MEKLRISLAAARTNAKLTQSELARELGVDRSTVWNWENGKTSPNSEQVRKISELARIPMDYIFLPDTLLKVENAVSEGG